MLSSAHPCYIGGMDAKQQQVVDQNERALRLQMERRSIISAPRSKTWSWRTRTWSNGLTAIVTRWRACSAPNDPKVSDTNRIKAASAAIAFERPKLTVNVQVGPALLGERLDHARLKKVEPSLSSISILHEGSCFRARPRFEIFGRMARLLQVRQKARRHSS